MGVKKVTFFIGIINFFSIRDKWEMAFCNTNFSLYQVSQLIVFDFTSDIIL